MNISQEIKLIATKARRASSELRQLSTDVKTEL